MIEKPTPDSRSVDGDNVQQSLDIAREPSNIDKHLSDDGSLFKSSNIDKLACQVADLQTEIESKNHQLSEKDSVITSLIECGILKDRELNDLRNRIFSIEHNSYATFSDNTVSDSMQS